MNFVLVQTSTFACPVSLSARILVAVSLESCVVTVRTTAAREKMKRTVVSLVLYLSLIEKLNVLIFTQCMRLFSDELIGWVSLCCLVAEVTCAPNQFQCAITKRCIPRVWVCDRDYDCVDESDEPANCSKEIKTKNTLTSKATFYLNLMVNIDIAHVLFWLLWLDCFAFLNQQTNCCTAFNVIRWFYS